MIASRLWIASICAASAPVQSVAAQEPDAVHGWTASSSATGCSAVYEAPATALSLRTTRDLRQGGDQRLYMSASLPWSVAGARLSRFTLGVVGEAEPLSEGSLIRVAGTGTSSANIALDAEASRRLFDKDGPVTLSFTNEGGVIGEITTDAFAEGPIGLEECLEKVGEKLMAQRAPGQEAGEGPFAPFPRTFPGRWVTTNDYPSRALRAESEGVSTATLTVSRYGFPTACTIVESAGDAALDQAACRSLQRRAQFFPARDDKGAAVEGGFTQPVRWQIPGLAVESED